MVTRGGLGRRLLQGFTLLEVMVATAILGLSLTVILSSQVGLFSSATYAQKISVATGLARCKMTELEEGFLKMGYPELDAVDEGPCCNNELRPDFSCKWKIERVELPQPDQFGQSDGGMSSLFASPAGSSGLSLGAPMMGADPSMLGLLGGGNALGDGLSGLGDGGVPSVSGMSGMAGLMASGGGMNGILSMGMTMVYPSLKPMLEASIRKVTVTVLWKDGTRARDLELLQWVTNPSKGGLILGAPAEATSSGTSPIGTSPGGIAPGGMTPGGMMPGLPRPSGGAR